MLQLIHSVDLYLDNSLTAESTSSFCDHSRHLLLRFHELCNLQGISFHVNATVPTSDCKFEVVQIVLVLYLVARWCFLRRMY